MKICIYGAASKTIDYVYKEKIEELGYTLAQRGHSLVFGGGASGCMGASAKGFTKGGGHITAVAPKFFDVAGIIYDKCDEIIFTTTMSERKQKFIELADAFIVTPGGIGTLDEFFELITLKQLGQCHKCVAIYDVNGFYTTMNEMLQKLVDEKFMSQNSQDLCKYFTDKDELIKYIENYTCEYHDILYYKPINASFNKDIEKKNK